MFISWNEIKNKIYNKSDCIWQLKLYRTEWNLRNNQSNQGGKTTKNEKKITNRFEEHFSDRSWSLKELGIISRKVLQNEARPLYLIKFKWSETAAQGCLRKRCSENMQQIYWRTPMPKDDFNKVALQLYWHRIWAWVFSCKFAVYF